MTDENDQQDVAAPTLEELGEHFAKAAEVVQNIINAFPVSTERNNAMQFQQTSLLWAREMFQNTDQAMMDREHTRRHRRSAKPHPSDEERN